MLRPDVRIGFFYHIPFPPVEIFTQLPWRRQVVEGLLGADLIGFQRSSDAANFMRAVRRLTPLTTKGRSVTVGARWSRPERTVRAGEHTSELQSRGRILCRHLREKNNRHQQAQ